MDPAGATAGVGGGSDVLAMGAEELDRELERQLGELSSGDEGSDPGSSGADWTLFAPPIQFQSMQWEELAADVRERAAGAEQGASADVVFPGLRGGEGGAAGGNPASQSPYHGGEGGHDGGSEAWALLRASLSRCEGVLDGVRSSLRETADLSVDDVRETQRARRAREAVQGSVEEGEEEGGVGKEGEGEEDSREESDAGKFEGGEEREREGMAAADAESALTNALWRETERLEAELEARRRAIDEAAAARAAAVQREREEAAARAASAEEALRTRMGEIEAAAAEAAKQAKQAAAERQREHAAAQSEGRSHALRARLAVTRIQRRWRVHLVCKAAARLRRRVAATQIQRHVRVHLAAQARAKLAVAVWAQRHWRGRRARQRSRLLREHFAAATAASAAVAGLWRRWRRRRFAVAAQSAGRTNLACRRMEREEIRCRRVFAAQERSEARRSVARRRKLDSEALRRARARARGMAGRALTEHSENDAGACASIGALETAARECVHSVVGDGGDVSGAGAASVIRVDAARAEALLQRARRGLGARIGQRHLHTALCSALYASVIAVATEAQRIRRQQRGEQQPAKAPEASPDAAPDAACSRHTSLIINGCSDGRDREVLHWAGREAPLLTTLSVTDVHVIHDSDAESDSCPPLPHLQRLVLSKCRLRTLPPVGGASVIECDVTGNMLTSIHEAASRWCSLQVLRAGGNRLDAAAVAAVTSLDQLIELSVPGNEIAHVPSLQPLKRLQVLDLSGNRLRSVDGTALASCPLLRVLRLSNNELQRPPLRLVSLTLRELWLDGNQLITLDPTATDGSSNVQSDTDRAELDSARQPSLLWPSTGPLSCGFAPSLAVLCVDDNRLRAMCPLPQWPHLIHLSARRNEIRDVASLAALEAEGSLQRVDLEGNPVCESPPFGAWLQRMPWAPRPRSVRMVAWGTAWAACTARRLGVERCSVLDTVARALRPCGQGAVQAGDHDQDQDHAGRDALHARWTADGWSGGHLPSPLVAAWEGAELDTRRAMAHRHAKLAGSLATARSREEMSADAAVHRAAAAAAAAASESGEQSLGLADRQAAARVSVANRSRSKSVALARAHAAELRLWPQPSLAAPPRHRHMARLVPNRGTLKRAEERAKWRAACAIQRIARGVCARSALVRWAVARAPRAVADRAITIARRAYASRVDSSGAFVQRAPPRRVPGVWLLDALWRVDGLCATIVQAWWRSVLARRIALPQALARRAAHTRAAGKIQRIFRGHRVRRRMRSAFGDGDDLELDEFAAVDVDAFLGPARAWLDDPLPVPHAPTRPAPSAHAAQIQPTPVPQGPGHASKPPRKGHDARRPPTRPRSQLPRPTPQPPSTPLHASAAHAATAAAAAAAASAAESASACATDRFTRPHPPHSTYSHSASSHAGAAAASAHTPTGGYSGEPPAWRGDAVSAAASFSGIGQLGRGRGPSPIQSPAQRARYVRVGDEATLPDRPPPEVHPGTWDSAEWPQDERPPTGDVSVQDSQSASISIGSSASAEAREHRQRQRQQQWEQRRQQRKVDLDRSLHAAHADSERRQTALAEAVQKEAQAWGITDPKAMAALWARKQRFGGKNKRSKDPRERVARLMRQVAHSSGGAGNAPEGPRTPAESPFRSQVSSDRATHRRRRNTAMPAWLPPIE